jgi:hypothetical protein
VPKSCRYLTLPQFVDGSDLEYHRF